jgi:hypothetical protein
MTKPEKSELAGNPHSAAADEAAAPDSVCPVCGAKLVSEKCKVVCRSERCRYRIVFNCAEF